MIPILVICAISLLSALWPNPKLDHTPPESGGIFAPHAQMRDIVTIHKTERVVDPESTWR